MKPKPKVGDRVFSLNVGNAARGCAEKLTPVVVKSVGRKYFQVESPIGERIGATEFNLDDWHERSKYSASARILSSEQEWRDEKDAKQIFDKIRTEFSAWTPPKHILLSDLRAISEILKQAELRS
jgi:hypothetical protein